MLCPSKPVEHLAADTHVSLRTARYHLAGQIRPSGADVRAAVDEMLEPDE